MEGGSEGVSPTRDRTRIPLPFRHLNSSPFTPPAVRGENSVGDDNL